MSDNRFTLTEEHLTLLRAMYVHWQDVEFGAPEIDPKRPYGNSSVLADMAELLGVGCSEDGRVAPADEERLRELHRQTEHALQVLLRLGSIEAGEYVREPYTADWRLA